MSQRWNVVWGPLIVLVLTFPWTGCSGIEERPWMENGQRIGTIRIQSLNDGTYEYEYFDRNERLMRYEDRDPNRDLMDYSRIGFNRYDGEGQLVETHFEDRHGKPATTNGFAKATYKYSENEMDAWQKTSYFDLEDLPVVRGDGVGVEIVRFAGPEDAPPPENDEPLVWRKEFYDEREQPVGTSVNGIANTAAIQYSYLIGAGEMVYVTHFDSEGNVIHKAHVKGVVRRHVTRTTYYY